MNRITQQDKRAVLALLERGFSQRTIVRMLGLASGTVGRIYSQRYGRKVMGRPPLGDKGRTKTVLVRVTEAEHEAIVLKAKNCKSVSEWIRRALRQRAREILNEEANH